MNVTLYIKPDCPLCDQAITELNELQTLIPHKLIKINIEEDQQMRERFQDRFPVVEVGPYRLRAPFDKQELQVLISAARDRINQLEKVDQDSFRQMVSKGQKMTSGDRVSFWLSRHYLLMVNLFILIYVGLPFLAPVLEKYNAPLPAQVIYRIYGTMCHQLAFRSWFLFGEQYYYPRELAGITSVTSYEALQNTSQLDLIAARNFIGNETDGFKVALCERDVAIYGFMFIFGIIYALSGRKIRAIPWYMWVVIGLVPIGIDGVSQLPSVAQGLPAWLPIRESTPFLRTLTGGLFGWMTAWYLYPMLESTMRETRQILTRKQAVIDQTKAI